jgi:hypothetical protein
MWPPSVVVKQAGTAEDAPVRSVVVEPPSEQWTRCDGKAESDQWTSRYCVCPEFQHSAYSHNLQIRP